MNTTQQTAAQLDFPGQADIQKFRDAYKTQCAGCPSMLAIPLPFVHCPSCHDRWRVRGLHVPTRCRRCHFKIGMWMRKNNVPDRSNAAALLP